MRIPLYLAVAQWALLLALAFLLIIVYRHLGRVFAPKPLSEHGPAAGSSATSFEYKRLSDETLQYVTPGDGQPILLAFVNPTCQACEKLVASFAVVRQAGDLEGLRALLLISDPPSYLQISAAFRATDLEIGRIATRATLSAYRVAATPLVVAIDGDGVIASAGAAAEVAELRAYARACVLPPPDSTLPVRPAGPESASDSQATILVATPERER